MKSILVVPLIEVYFFEFIDKEWISTTYRFKNKYLKLISVFITYIDIFGLFNRLIFGKWYKLRKKYNIIFLDGCTLRYKLRKIIKKHNNMYIYLWNPSFDSKYLNSILSMKEKVSTFDRSDSKKYGIKFINTFYCPTIIEKNNSNIYNLFFIGNDKGRKVIIDYFKHICDANNIISYIYIPNESNKQLTYKEYLDILSQSNTILEIVQSGQVGPTMRTMECIFYRKKMITNNVSIIEEDFYDPDYIFVFEDVNSVDINKLIKFLNSDSIPKENLSEKYNFYNWIKNFEIL